MNPKIASAYCLKRVTKAQKTEGELGQRLVDSLFGGDRGGRQDRFRYLKLTGQSIREEKTAQREPWTNQRVPLKSSADY